MTRTRSITEIINVHALEWEHRRRAAQREVMVQPRQAPVVTLSSEYGSRGQDVAAMVARQLGFNLFDRELIDRVMASANASRRLVESLDDRVRDWISEHITIQFSGLSSSEFLEHLVLVVLALGHHGRSVILGRGAQFILDPRYTLRVRTIGPLEARVAHVAASEGLTELQARQKVERKTEDRRAFCRLHFERDVSDPCHYDLTLNTAGLPLELAAETVVHTFRQRFPVELDPVAAKVGGNAFRW